MEQNGVEIESIELADNHIHLKYVNGAEESLSNSLDTYKQFYELWLKDNPPFISDVHKSVMRNIILSAINDNPKCMAELQAFFNHPNEESVKKFLTYMRKRNDILPEKKAIWNVS